VLQAYEATPKQFGAQLGHVKPASKQEWFPSAVVFTVGSVVFSYLYSIAPNTSIDDWAKDEAEERARRRERGQDVEYGMNYAPLAASGRPAE
jgi:hypothetical protein